MFVILIAIQLSLVFFTKLNQLKMVVVLDSEGLERTFNGTCLELKIVPPKIKLKRNILSITKPSTSLEQ